MNVVKRPFRQQCPSPKRSTLMETAWKQHGNFHRGLSEAAKIHRSAVISTFKSGSNPDFHWVSTGHGNFHAAPTPAALSRPHPLTSQFCPQHIFTRPPPLAPSPTNPHRRQRHAHAYCRMRHLNGRRTLWPPQHRCGALMSYLSDVSQQTDSSSIGFTLNLPHPRYSAGPEIAPRACCA